MNTITKISTDPAKGVYRHEETGFVMHDVWSVADVVSANGAIALDMVSGSWSWVAGEDLYIEVYKRGASTLNNLAQNLLDHTSQLTFSGITVGLRWLGPAANDDLSGWLLLPRMLRNARTMGNDLRLFAVYTNLQAGRGMSSDLLSDSVLTKDNGATNTHCTFGTINADLSGYEGRNSYSLNADADATVTMFATSAVSYAKSSTVIGRAVVAIPLKSWDNFLSGWFASLEHNDEPEVAEKANAAISKFRTVFQDKVFNTPSVRVPIVLTSDGKSYIDTNPSRSIVKPSAGNIGTMQTYNPLVSPTIVDNLGHWITNPHCAAPGVTHSMLPFLHEGMGYRTLSPGPVPSSWTSGTGFVLGYSEVNRIGSVDLFKIAGGFFPRVPSVVKGVSESDLIGRIFAGNPDDQSLPAQLGGETTTTYQDRLAGMIDSSKYAGLGFNYGHWHLCGQVTLLVATLLDGALQGRTMRGKDLLTSGSGNLCKLLRCVNKENIHTALVTDISSNAAEFLLHQYGG